MQGSYSLRLTDDQIDDAVRRYRAGDPVHAIAAHYACSDSVIRNALKLRGVVMRIGGGRTTTPAGGRYRYS